MFIDGIAIAGFRSFGDELQTIGRFSKINLLIGQNNSGKSNIIRFITFHAKGALSAASRKSSGLKFESVDKHLGSDSNRLKIGFVLDPQGEVLDRLLRPREEHLNQYIRNHIRTILTSKTMSRGTDLAWFIYEAAWGTHVGKLEISSEMVKSLRQEQVLDDNEWLQVWRRLTGANGGNLEQNWIPETLSFLSPVDIELPATTMIPAIRQVNLNVSDTENDFSGAGIINRLARLQNPNHDQQHLKQRFEEINNFLRVVTANNTATLEIPFERNTILVHIDGRVLPLESLGTGIHEVIILAAAATVLQNQILCIEEPEIHLHPILQRKLIKYLYEKTNNQYFIASHSAHLLDALETSVFHVQLQTGQSRVTKALTPSAKALICNELGYRPSDLLQSNSIIWVEGPSDRIYINHWIKKKAPHLVEGLHYSIMFYGGRLLSHLSANDPEVEDFISLRRLNRHISVVIDSDVSTAKGRINATKQRIRDEFNSGPGLAWITKGREIENYIPRSLLVLQRGLVKRVPNGLKP